VLSTGLVLLTVGGVVSITEPLPVAWLDELLPLQPRRAVATTNSRVVQTGVE